MSRESNTLRINYMWYEVWIPYRVLCWRWLLSSLCAQVAPWERVERPTTCAPTGHYWAHVTSPPCHHPTEPPNPSEQLPKYISYTADLFAIVATSSPAWHSRQAATGTDLFVPDPLHNFPQTPPHTGAGAQGKHVLLARINLRPGIVMHRRRDRLSFLPLSYFQLSKWDDGICPSRWSRVTDTKPRPTAEIKLQIFSILMI